MILLTHSSELSKSTFKKIEILFSDSEKRIFAYILRTFVSSGVFEM